MSNFADYQGKLHNAKVVLDPAERRAAIKAQAEQIAGETGYQIKSDEALLDEVTGLVEWPVVLMGRIDDAFMGIPPSGKIFRFSMVFVLDLRNGRIIRDRRIYDFTGWLVQLGVLRAKPA